MSTEKLNTGHQNREDLAGEHKFGDAGQLIIAVIFLAVWILDSFVFKYTTFLDKYILLPLQIILGFIQLFTAFYLARAGMNTVFNEVREKPAVIKKGVFGIIRHPIYFGEILFYLGLLFFRLSLAALFIWLIAIVFLALISRYEEKLLIAKFGDDYRQYMKDVGMFFPKLWRPGAKKSS
jgi:protein-S-isoprenylcysteine O-methyltransferase Ste14